MGGREDEADECASSVVGWMAVMNVFLHLEVYIHCGEGNSAVELSF